MNDQGEQPPLEHNEQRELRIEKLKALRAQGIDPFLVERCERSHNASEISNEESYTILENQQVSIAGRLAAKRAMGKASFAHLADESGRVQIYVKKDDVGDSTYEIFRGSDLGDFLAVKGYVFRTRTGEISVHAQDVSLISKALRPPPFGKLDDEGEAHGALSNTEDRYRYRHLDLLANPDSRIILTKRCRIVSAMRRFLDGQGFLEVETPVLQLVAGGAAARPFKTYHNALDHEFKLRISLELYLKRLIIGGFEKVYEIGRIFRNEGISTRHNPEFTMMELYQAYADLDDIMHLVEGMLVSIAQEVNSSPTFQYQGQTIDLSARPWRRLPMLEGIREYAGIEPSELNSLDSAKSSCRRINVSFDLEKEATLGGLIEKLHEVYTQPNLIQPTFITDFPVETSPLAKKRQDNPALTRRFEVYAAAQELGNAFSEINDPLDQRERFEAQVFQREAGDDEAHPMDEDFLKAMEYGMPPTGGLGIGIDRLAMILTEADSIRDVLLFPLMRPEK